MIKADVMRRIAEKIDSPEKWIRGNERIQGANGEFLYCMLGAIRYTGETEVTSSLDFYGYTREYIKFIAGLIGEMHPEFVEMAPTEMEARVFMFNDSRHHWEDVNAVMEKAVIRAEEMEGLQ